ncbi:MAG: hypothetical protein ACI934_000363 [Pseudohongiellaceae bacterium]
MKISAAEENRFAQNHDSRPVLRRYPYPYTSAIAISNDTDFMSSKAFLDWHKFVNGTADTPYGQGLGLEVGDSFWVWNDEGAFSIFQDGPWNIKQEPSADSELIKEFSNAGFLDTLHGFGSWDSDFQLNRELSESAIKIIQHHDLKPRIYVNHGGGHLRKHNIGGPWHYYQKGDDPSDPSYCLDLLTEIGIQYYWTDVCFENEKFGEYKHYRNDIELHKEFDSYNFRRFLYSKDSGKPKVRNKIFPALSDAELFVKQSSYFNRLLIPETAQDGRDIYFFKRYRGREGPNVSTFASQVNDTNLDSLEQHQAAVVIYQHFGVWRALGREKRHVSQKPTLPPVLDENAVWAFRELARRQDEGRLFITTTSRLLDYLRLRQHLRYQLLNEGDRHIIELEYIDCPVSGHVDLQQDMLQGLSFEIPTDWKDTDIMIKGVDNKIETTRIQAKGAEPVDVIYVPWKRLSFPE